ncbi:MAG: response regulator [Thainema sp.]
MLSYKSVSTRPISVVIADDHDLTRLSLKLAIKQRGPTNLVGMAKNGKEAVELVQQCRPDVVVLDMQMPVMDGPSASHLIRQIQPNAKIIAYSSLAGKSLEQMLQEAEYDAFCDKETDTQELLDLIIELGNTQTSAWTG